MIDEYNFGIEIDITHLPLLQDALKKAQTRPQSFHDGELMEKSPAERVCIAVDMDQTALATARSCRYLASRGTCSCRTFYFRNPITSETLVTHLSGGIDESQVFKELEAIVRSGSTLEMYVVGGDRRDGDKHGHDYEFTVAEIEETLCKVNEFAEKHNVTVIPKVMNLFNCAQTDHSALDLVSGELKYITTEAIKPFVVVPDQSDNVEVPVTVFHRLEIGWSKPR